MFECLLQLLQAVDCARHVCVCLSVSLSRCLQVTATPGFSALYDISVTFSQQYAASHGVRAAHTGTEPCLSSSNGNGSHAAAAAAGAGAGDGAAAAAGVAEAAAQQEQLGPGRLFDLTSQQVGGGL